MQINFLYKSMYTLRILVFRIVGFLRSLESICANHGNLFSFSILSLKFVTSQKLWLIKKYGIVRMKKLLYFLGWGGGMH